MFLALLPVQIKAKGGQNDRIPASSGEFNLNSAGFGIGKETKGFSCIHTKKLQAASNGYQQKTL